MRGALVAEPRQDQGKKYHQMVEDKAEIVSGGGEECVHGVADGAEQIVAIEPAVILHVADHGLDGGSSLEFTLDAGCQATALAGQEDALGSVIVVPAITPVGVDALGLDAGDGDDVLDGSAE